LIVTGGLGTPEGSEDQDTMEYLIMNDTFKCNDWQVCLDHLPERLYDHQINIFQNKLILTGGCSSRPNKAWEGNISFEPELRVKWTPLPSMLEFRDQHVAAVIGDKLFCIGGFNNKSTEYYSSKTNSWQKGPDLPFTLIGAKGIVNSLLCQCFIVGGIVGDDHGQRESSKVYLFDPQKGLIDIQGEFGTPRSNHIAVLL
jgi:hypothetical protein